MRGIGAGQRIFELLDRQPAIPPGVGVALPPWRTGVLRFENLFSTLLLTRIRDAGDRRTELFEREPSPSSG